MIISRSPPDHQARPGDHHDDSPAGDYHLMITSGPTPLVDLIQWTGLGNHWKTIAPTDLSLNDNNAWGGEKEKNWQDGDPPHLHELHFGIWGESKEDPFLFYFEGEPTEPTVESRLPLLPPSACNVIPGGGSSWAPRWKGQGGPEQANQGQIRLAFLFLSILFLSAYSASFVQSLTSPHEGLTKSQLSEEFVKSTKYMNVFS